MLNAYKLIIQFNPTGVYSTRDLENLSQRFYTLAKECDATVNPKELVYQACVAEFAGNIKTETMRNEYKQTLAGRCKIRYEQTLPQAPLIPIQYHNAKTNALDTLYIPSEKADMIEAIRQDIRIRERMMAQGGDNFYKQGILIQGDAGLGKSTLCSALLEEAGFRTNHTDTQKKYYVISAGDVSAHELLLKAFHEGAAVVLDELNLDEKLEELLNQLLMDRRVFMLAVNRNQLFLWSRLLVSLKEMFRGGGNVSWVDVL